MTAATLIKLLDEKCQYYYSGPLQEEIYSVQMVGQGEVLSPNILYVSYEWRNVVVTQNICLLSIPEKEADEIIYKLRALIIKDYRRNVKLGRMGVMAAGDNAMEELCSLAFEIMGNPVCFLSPNYQVCESAGDKNIELYILKIRQSLQSTSIAPERGMLLLDADTVFPYRRMLLPVYRETGVSGYLYIMESLCPFMSKVDEYYAKQICRLLSVRKSLMDTVGVMSEEQYFIKELIKGSLIDKDLIEQKMKHFGLCVRVCYYVFSVNLESSTQIKMIRDQLSRLLDTPVYDYDGYGVALLGENNLDEEKDKITKELISYLKQLNLHAGISNIFTDMRMMPNAFKESVYAVSLRKRLTDKVYLSFYREIAGLHMYCLMEEAGIQVSRFCDPAALQIEQYDREHGTKYLNSLVVYICKNCSLQQAADVLYIHKSTLLKHIRVFEERFHIDFDNHREMNSLRRTLEIFSYLGKIDVQKLLGNEQ